MLDPSLYKSLLQQLISYTSAYESPFQGNPDYPGYWALFTADPTNDTLTSVEATYTGYARVRTYRNPGHFFYHDGPPAWCGNSSEVNFPSPTGGAGEILTHWAHLYPDSIDGSYQIVASGPLENPLTVAVGMDFLFPINTLIVQAPG